MATYGYGRVSREQQTTENQRQVIELQRKIPVDKWFEEHAVSGKIKAKDRPAFAEMNALLKAGDTAVFTRVDRISRRASDTLNVVEELLERGVEVFILQMGEVPLSSQMGKMMLGVYAIFAEGERLSIIERTKDGLARTKRQGTKLGRPTAIHPCVLKEMIERRPTMTLAEMSDKYNVPLPTIDRNIKKWSGKIDEYRADYNARMEQYLAAAEKV